MGTIQNTAIRNLAIIAHVDHGKTTLIDALFSTAGLGKDEDRLMDSMDLERERGITIAAKNCSIEWKGIKLNLLDTPGHADFGGEVERALMMVDGVLLLVDAAEGPLPQTRFVLEKALKQGLSIIVCINKIDRGDARPKEILDMVYDLFIDLDADEDQLDFPVLYTIGRDGKAGTDPEKELGTLDILLDSIIEHIPAPTFDDEEPFQLLVSNIGYSDYVGRLAVGRIAHGEIKSKDPLARIGRDGNPRPFKVNSLQVYSGPATVDTDQANAGEIIILSGAEEIEIGDTVTLRENPSALPRIEVEEPTVAMRFMGNNSPLSGKDGKYIHPQKIEERLKKEILYNVSLKLERDPSGESFLVHGRGVLQLAILVETMRREGFELALSRPEPLFKTDGEKTLEPIEHLVIDVDSEFTGAITQTLGTRKGILKNMVDNGAGRTRLEFSVPSRALIGYRSKFLTDTRGTGLMSSYLEGYEEYKGDIPGRVSGSLVADRPGSAVPYALFNLEPRGKLLITPGEEVYEGMVIGEHSRENDLDVNPTKTKKLTNVRAAGKDDAVVLSPVRPMTLEQALEFISEDELVEVTPKNIRLRKKVLASNQRPKKKSKQL